MARRLGLAMLSALLLALLAPSARATTSPAAQAAIGPVTVVPAGCDFESVTADAAATSGAITRGFVSFHGGGCGLWGSIWYFQGSGNNWSSVRSTLRGRVLATADDGASTFLLYQSSAGIWVTKRPHIGGLTAGRRLSTFAGVNPYPTGDLVAFTDQWWAVWTEQIRSGDEFAPMKLFQGKTIGAGDCIDPIYRQQITFLPQPNDEHPSLVLKPASAGRSGADLVWSRNDGAQGLSGHIYQGAADCTARWRFRQLSFTGRLDLAPDAVRLGAGVNHVVWTRDGYHVVYVNNATGVYRGRTFITQGVGPRVTTSLGVVFVGFRNLDQHPFVGIYRNGVWSGRDLTPGAGPQRLLAITAAGGRGTVLAASEVTDRLYAIAGL